MAESQVHGQINGSESDHNPGDMDSAKGLSGLAQAKGVMIAVQI
jgi:hypothetical protein